MKALPNNSLAMSWFHCTTCWKIFNLRIQLATHLKKRHNDGGIVRCAKELSEKARDRAKPDDREKEEKVTPTQNMTACHASDAFICGFDCNEQFPDLQMKSAHCLEAQNSELSKSRKYFPKNNELSPQQTLKTTIKDIPVYDISSSENESKLQANTNRERRVEVEEKVPISTCEGLGSRTVTNLTRQHPPESTFPTQLNHMRIFSPSTNRKNKDEVLKSNRLRQGKMLHKGRRRRCPYCSQNFLLSVDIYRHIKAVHGQLLTRNATSMANCNESKKSSIHTPARSVISKSSYPAKSKASDTKSHVRSGSTYSIKGYKCQFCLKMFRRLAVFKSHFRVKHGFLRFIPSFVLKKQRQRSSAP